MWFEFLSVSFNSYTVKFVTDIRVHGTVLAKYRLIIKIPLNNCFQFFLKESAVSMGKLLLSPKIAIYSAAQKKRYEYCSMKQKCHIQMVVVQYENTAITLNL